MYILYIHVYIHYEWDKKWWRKYDFDAKEEEKERSKKKKNHVYNIKWFQTLLPHLWILKNVARSVRVLRIWVIDSKVNEDVRLTIVISKVNLNKK